jgi:hypothetical protein
LSSGRTARLVLAVLAAVLLAMLVSFGLQGRTPEAQADTTDVGYRDFSYTGTASPTGNKPQDKLWYTSDGTWWGILFNSATDYNIFRFNKATQSWSDTGVLIDKRNNTKSDTLWDGNHLYIASSTVSAAGTDQSAYLRRYSYDPATQKWSLDSGFPALIGTGAMEAITLTKDSTGKLWVTFTQPDSTGQFRQVYVNHSLDSDSSWGQPYALPVAGANNLSPSLDDISAIVSFDLKTQAPKVGIMWSNQNDGAIYFAAHPDGTSDDNWQPYPAPVQGTKAADDHISIRALDTDPSGRVFAVTKTSFGDTVNKDPNAPLVYMSVLGQDGIFTKYVVNTVQDDVTRPILTIDTSNRQVYVFAAAPLKNTVTNPDGTVSVLEPRTIFYKKTSLDNISFPTGRGTPFIRNAADSFTDNPTSTDQNVTNASGLLVMASSDDAATGTHDYLHNYMELGNSDTTPPDTTIDSGPTGTVISNSASFSFSSTEANSTFQCSLDGAAFSSCSSPQSYTNLSEGQHTFKVAAVDSSGNLDASPASATWTVDSAAPDTAITSGPTGTVSSNSASFSFSSTEANSTFECSLDGAAFSSCTSPQSYTNLSEGQHSFKVRAIGGAAGNVDPTPASVTWTVDTTAPDTTITSGLSGTVKDKAASFSFSSTEPNSKFECSLDGAAFSSCTSPTKYNGLKDGQHTFRVRAIDAAGNVDPTPATNSWTVNTKR